MENKLIIKTANDVLKTELNGIQKQKNIEIFTLEEA